MHLADVDTDLFKSWRYCLPNRTHQWMLAGLLIYYTQCMMVVVCHVYAWLRVCIGISVLVLKRGLVTQMAPKQHLVAGKAELTF